MSDSDLARDIVAALAQAAGEGALVSVEITRARAGAAHRIDASVTRRTRTLVFAAASALGADSAAVASASAVFRIADS